MTLVQAVTLVKLTRGEYSAPLDSIGFINQFWPDGADSWEDVTSVAISWTENPGKGGGSVPVAMSDLEILGQIWVPVPPEILKAEIEKAQVEIPEWLVKVRAKQMLIDVLKKLEGEAN